MNCKQGDLAVIVDSDVGNCGKIVRCVSLHGSRTHDLDGLKFDGYSSIRWVIDPPVSCGWVGGGFGNLYTIEDQDLRPIRPTDGEDETLSWKAVPKQPETV